MGKGGRGEDMSTNKPAGGAKFTQGPWHLEHDVDGIPLTIIGSDGSAIGTVETWNDCTEGNRLVLTAAPAMYEALKALLAMQIECEGLLLTIEKDYHCHQTRQARAALAQAEGK